MTDEKIRVGVIGLGAFGRHHVRHFATQTAGRLVAVADADRSRADGAANEYAAVAFADPLALIGKVDAVSIATPASHHALLAREFLKAGVHVLIEKPLATTVADARDLVALAESSGVILQVGHIERFSPAVREMRQRVSDARRITTIRRAPMSDRSRDVDVVLDMMIHDIDHVLSFADSPVTSVAASGDVIRGPHADEAEAWLTFENGAVATLSASRAADRVERKLTVTDLLHVFAADLGAPSLAIAERRGRAPAEVIGFSPHDSLAAEIAAFLRSIRTGTPPEAGGLAGLAAVEVAVRIQAAIADSDLPLRRSI